MVWPSASKSVGKFSALPLHHRKKIPPHFKKIQLCSRPPVRCYICYKFLLSLVSKAGVFLRKGIMYLAIAR